MSYITELTAVAEAMGLGGAEHALAVDNLFRIQQFQLETECTARGEEFDYAKFVDAFCKMLATDAGVAAVNRVVAINRESNIFPETAL